ncbi:AroM family protein [Paenibacillus sp. 32352]|uniref:AroM family protein n=1 Tax=Paenibacillus sp. 32352 TaxID=1969111 RepID=UPI0009AE4D60|nr:AroM family protein [Paenibacillus sp. 32352]
MLGLLTLGHSPRADLEVPFRSILPSSVPIAMKGGLDGLTPDAILLLAKQAGEHPLHVITQDGPVVIQQEALIGPLEQRANELADAGAKLVVLLCAGDFPPFQSQAVVILPGQLLENKARSTAGSSRLGVVVPAESQVQAAGRRWRQAGFEPAVMLPPDGTGAVEELIDNLRSAEVEQVVLDCISFTWGLKQKLHEELGVPVWLPSELAAREAKEQLLVV